MLYFEVCAYLFKYKEGENYYRKHRFSFEDYNFCLTQKSDKRELFENGSMGVI